MDKEIIKAEIESFKSENGGGYADYYIGITNDINRRLVESSPIVLEHLKNGWYTKGFPFYSAECDSNDDAVKIERFFQNLGMLKFNPSSYGVEESVFIYCFKINENNSKMILEKAEFFLQILK
jgi:hypothetical protein